MNIFRARVQAVKFCLGLAVLTASLTVFTGCGSSADSTEESSVPVAAPVTTSTKITRPVFDVPSLIGKNIDEVTAVLGPSTRTAQEKRVDAQDASQDENYSKPEADLLVSYTTMSKVVTQFFVIVHGPNGDNVTDDASQLMVAGNLTNNDVRYKVELVNSQLDPKRYTGIKVTPYFLPTPIPTPNLNFPVFDSQKEHDEDQKRQMREANALHNITFRITGTSAGAFGVKYSEGWDNVTEIAQAPIPWVKSFTARKGVRFSLSANPVQNRGTLTVEILIDGVVTDSDTSTEGIEAHCSASL